MLGICQYISETFIFLSFWWYKQDFHVVALLHHRSGQIAFEDLTEAILGIYVFRWAHDSSFVTPVIPVSSWWGSRLSFSLSLTHTHTLYPPPAAISSRISHTHEHNFSTIFSNFQTLLGFIFSSIKGTYWQTKRLFWINRSYGSVGRCLLVRVSSEQWAVEKQRIQLAGPQQTRQ